MEKKVRKGWPSGKALALHSEERGFDPGGLNQKYHNSRFHHTNYKKSEGLNQKVCSLYDEILNYDISDFDLRDRTLALRSAKRRATYKGHFRYVSSIFFRFY